MPLSLFSRTTVLSRVRLGFLYCCLLAIVVSGISSASLRRTKASGPSGIDGTEATPKPLANSPFDARRNKASNPSSGAQSYGKLPLAFEVNRGQADSAVKFMARGQRYGLFLTSSKVVLRLARPTETGNANDPSTVDAKSQKLSSPETATLIMGFEGSRSDAHPIGLEELPGKSNYFIGNQASDWRTKVDTYAKILYPNIYKGIDLVYYGNQSQMEYDLIVAPGVSPQKIGMTFAGASSINIDSSGDLLLTTAQGNVRQHKPVAYQQVDGVRRQVTAAYRVKGNRVGFEIGSYDRKLPLIIDPVLVYSSFVGGTSGEQGLGIAVDSQGATYLTGTTASADFPVVAALQGAKEFSNDIFVVKLNPAGSAIIYATYLGGNVDEVAHAIAADSQGNAYVTGVTASSTFPTTPGAFQSSNDGAIDAFVTKFNSTGSALVYSSYVGGDNNDTAFGIAVDASNRAYLVGRTDSTRFGTVPLSTPRNGSAIYKSTNAAANWSPSSAGLTASLVNSLTQDPVTAATIYAGTGSGVFKSIDGGANWSLTGSGAPASAPIATNAVVVDPSNPNTIYAATFSGVHKSTDGGVSYVMKNTGITSPAISSLAIDPNAPSILYAGTAFAGVFKSTDGGENWVGINNGITSGRVNEIVIDPSQNPATTIYVGMSNRGVLKTTNSGALWNQLTGGLSSFAQVNALAIDPNNPATLYVGVAGSTPVFKTTNGGGSWSPSGSGLTFTFAGQPAVPTVNTLAIDPLSSANVYAATSGGGIYKSTNGGANWNQSNSGFANGNATVIAVDRSNTANLYAATSIGSDVFAARFSASGSLEYLLNFGGDESDEARAVAVDEAGNAYVVGLTSSSNLPVVNAFQAANGGFGDAFVAKINSSGAALSWLTYLGGNSTDQARGVAIRNGSVYVAGSTSSSNFPLANPLKGTLATFDTDAFITRLNTAGALDFSTYLGGQSLDQAFAIAVDQNGSAYVTGATSSFDFPIVSAPQTSLAGSLSDAFVTKLNPANTGIAYSTFLGGTGADQGNGIAVDAAGNAYIIGTTSSVNFPTVSPIQGYGGSTEAFVAKLGAAADLVVTMTGSPNSLAYGSNLTYTIVVTNSGEIAAENVRLNDTLLSGTGVISINTTRGSCAGNRFITCDFSTLDPGASATVTLVVRPPAVATMINTATATTTTPEAATANNTAALSTPVAFTDLMLKNTSALTLTEIGGINTYIITVTNKGPAAASTITVTNNLPPETTFVSCNSTGAGVCGGSGNNRTVTVPSLAVGATFTATIAAQLNGTVAPGTLISDTASVTSAVPDINPNNDAQTATTVAKAASAPIQNGLIAFISRDGSFTTGDDIWISNPDGTGHQNIVHGVSPAWSPDGTRIAYVVWPVGIYVMNADGSNNTQLTTSSQDASPTWSPDGTRIAYSGYHLGSSGIHIVNSDGTYVKRIAAGGSPTWSPDGTRFAFFGSLGFSVMYADGAGITKVPLPNTPTGYSWSPDSSQLAISLPDNGQFGSSIYIVKPDGSGLTKIDNTFGGASPSWSPDGTKIAFSRPVIAGAPLEVHTVNLDGTGLLRINGPLKGGYDADWQKRPGNFTPLPPSFTISGKLTSAANGNPVGGSVNVTGSLTRTVSADSTNGDYVIKGLPLGGNYTLSPSIFGGAPTTPPNRVYNNLSSNQTGADFAFNFPAQEPVTGFVKDPTGAPLAGVRLGLGNSFGGTAFTDSTGFYTFGSAFPGAQAYVIPFAEGTYANYQFDPQILFIQSRSGNNFVGRPKTASISGTVTVGGVGKAGVLVSTSNPPATSTTTDANGNYTFNAIGQGLAVTVTVDTRVYPFSPASQTITVNGQTTGVNFAAPLDQYLITGQVGFNGSGIDGVTMTLSGSANATTQTDSRGNYSFGPLPANAAYSVTAAKAGHSFVPSVANVPNLVSNTALGFSGHANTVQFYSDSTNVRISETDGKATLTVVRSGLLTETVKVDYSTSDGTAGQRTDYTATLGTLTFAPQEQAKTIIIPTSDDSYVEGDESFTVTLLNPVGTLIPVSVSTVTIEDDDTAAPTINHVDSGSFFVRQHYLDFLNRLPDSSGLTFWSEQITDCGLDVGCTDVRRTNVSAAFYLSIEFQETGYLVERIYKSAYGDASGTSNFGPTHQLPVPVVRFNEFLPDTQQIGRGIVVGVGNWQAQLEANKVAFAQDFVTRARFTSAYPTSLTPGQFVDALYVKAGVTPSGAELSSVVNEFGGAGNTADTAARARALRRVAENSTLIQQESNKAFVLMQYFGYLRRNPNDVPDADYSGYDFWLTKLNEFNGNYIAAEMVRAFISSTEYRGRFGP